MFGNAFQGGKQAFQLYTCMLDSLIAFLGSGVEYLRDFWDKVKKNEELRRDVCGYFAQWCRFYTTSTPSV